MHPLALRSRHAALKSRDAALPAKRGPTRCCCAVAPARTAHFEPPPTPARTDPIPASSDRITRAGLLLDMSENAAPQQLAAGDDEGGGNMADARVWRAALLTQQLAEECATKMFTERADGPHASKIDQVAVRPTVEEIAIGQAAVLAALGEKGSEKRAHANRLCADGLIDLEQGLGYVLCDRFAGMMPTPLEARGVGKRAADRLPGRKERERWKDKAQAARKAARKAGADAAAVEAAGLAARTKAEAAFTTVEVSVAGLERAAAPEPEPPEPPTPEPPPTPEWPPEGTLARARLDMMMSPEAEPLIHTAYTIIARTHPSRRPHLGPVEEDETLELAQVRFMHALRRLRAAHDPALTCCSWDEQSVWGPREVLGATIAIHSTGHSIPAAVAAAQRTRFNLEMAAADYRSHGPEPAPPAAE